MSSTKAFFILFSNALILNKIFFVWLCFWECLKGGAEIKQGTSNNKFRCQVLSLVLSFPLMRFIYIIFRYWYTIWCFKNNDRIRLC